MHNNSWIYEIKFALRELYPQEEERKLTYSKFYRAVVLPGGKDTIKHTFGSALLPKLLKLSRNLFKKNTFKFQSIKFNLPKDAIVFFRNDKQGIIVSSYSKKTVTKVFYKSPHVQLLNEEIQNLKEIGKTSFSNYVPRLINEGITSNGARWMTTSFRSNAKAIGNRLDRNKFFITNFSSLILPAISEFYLTSSPKVTKLNEWLERVEKRIETHPSKEGLEILISSLKKVYENFPQYEVIESNLHNDLHAGNVLVGENEITIIDWEGIIRGLVIIDFVDISRRYLNQYKKEARAFHLFMSGGEALLPSPVQILMDNYGCWARNALKAHVPEGSERITFILYAIERTLILFEKKGVDRLKDARGFEARILACCQSALKNP